MTNLEQYKKELKRLISEGGELFNGIQYECYPTEFKKQAKIELKDKFEKYIKSIKPFKDSYQSWYSESLALIKQMLPDRVADFVKLYGKPKTRKNIEYGNYVIEDYLQNLTITSGGFNPEKKVGPEAAIKQFEQQLSILRAVERRFESKLFDIKQLTHADIFDSEIESAKELNKKGFVRGAGAIAGVVLEKHLAQVCENLNVKIGKKTPSISDFNDKLKTEGIYETPSWRKIQHLGDLRNLCDHNKEKEPTKEEVNELITGVDTFIKTLF